ncbi:hypothetical protein P879_07429 [Paragonimus westermani]|uniref:Uncharacterized protein n=1 Tax=Paragonimus westermani TaxID=34504 RepID=A0A8T0DLJ1_9TREM|nr:hypothetical protein P879_07429 [Paragonimus westermani]
MGSPKASDANALDFSGGSRYGAESSTPPARDNLLEKHMELELMKLHIQKLEKHIELDRMKQTTSLCAQVRKNGRTELISRDFQKVKAHCLHALLKRN